ncbi:hypothetical protein KCX80_03555 [Paenibacillus mucilaginosus]|uniref:Uncharacterized protein n=2 Tax=Paenibacillus mucilaginosus TaxID=61624 RepID=F8FR89_PAEMK|nr:hypothetical protein KNP414_00749 [Paenibacillus mucilaginosus KNP414]WDM28331.1 hypothetical protein KCX80_03555 [Paenibacillus mucilaginosus]
MAADNVRGSRFWELGRGYMRMKARPLERALFAYEFEGGPASEVIAALGAYRNEDGGFGRGLEPDIRCRASSVLATTVALQHLALLPKQDGEELIRGALGYLTAVYDPHLPGWEKVPPAVHSAPRAPWWDYRAPGTDWGNPNAEIAGYFKAYEEWAVSSEWVDGLVEQAVRHLNENSTLDEFHELLCYLRMAERVPLAVQARMSGKLGEMVERCTVKEPQGWEGYGLQPVGAAPTPQSPYYERFADVLPANLDWLLDRQTEEGAWEPAWSWGRDEDEWAAAREEWKSVITLNNLRILRAYGRG